MVGCCESSSLRRMPLLSQRTKRVRVFLTLVSLLLSSDIFLLCACSFSLSLSRSLSLSTDTKTNRWKAADVVACRVGDDGTHIVITFVNALTRWKSVRLAVDDRTTDMKFEPCIAEDVDAMLNAVRAVIFVGGGGSDAVQRRADEESAAQGSGWDGF